jgi:hypothetical protein
MCKQELLKALAELAKNFDTEVAHIEADDLLIEYINDEEIKKAYDEVSKWYA